jgi:hypothetical protein
MWRQLPVRIYVTDEKLLGPTHKAVEIMNEGFNRSVFLMSTNSRAPLRLYCDKERVLPMRDAGATFAYLGASIYLGEVFIDCDWSARANPTVVSNIIAHELYHVLGFMTPGLGHSYNVNCISFPYARKEVCVCDEMKKAFHDRYPVETLPAQVQKMPTGHLKNRWEMMAQMLLNGVTQHLF